MIWLYIALVAYLINAVAFILDKYLLHAPIPRPFAYSFWVSLLSSAVLVLIPFGVRVPDTYSLSISLLSGGFFFLSLIFLYRAIRMSEISTVATKVGAITAISTFIFSSLLLKDYDLSLPHMIALGLMVVGMLFLNRFKWEILWITALAGMSGGMSFTLLKMSFIQTNLVNGVFWTRVGFIGAALISLLFTSAREDVIASFKKSSKSSKYLFLTNKLIAAAGFLMLYYAMFKGDTSIINGMSGLQYVFLFIAAILLRNVLPGMQEDLHHRTLIMKVTGLLFIIAGFIVLNYYI